jgi:hypothetical protein
MEKLKTALSKANIGTKTCSCSELECDQSCLNSSNNEKKPLVTKDKAKTFSIQYSSSFTDISYEVININLENNNNEYFKIDDYEEVNSEEHNFLKNCLFRLITLPIRLIMTITIPKPSKKYFVITFILSIVWMAILSYFTVTSVQFLSKNFLPGK